MRPSGKRKPYKVTPEEKSRSMSANARKARAASPWGRGPNCASTKAQKSFDEYMTAGDRSHGITPSDKR